MRERIGQNLEAACLVMLLGVVGLRPLIAETYDSAGLSLTRALQNIQDPLPFATLMIDAVILLAALVWLISRILLNDRTYRWCGIEWGGVMLALAAGASCVFAGNRRLAINGAADWLSVLLLAVVLTQLLRDRWRIRLAVCVVVASASAQAVECLHQAFYVIPETEAAYASQREEIWSSQGVPLDSERVQLFEARMKAREASGYLAHANVAGAHLVMGCLVAFSAGVATRRRGDRTVSWLSAVPLWLLAMLLAYAAYLTRALGAMTAGAIMLVLLAWCLWKTPTRRSALIGGWAVAGCFALGVLAYGQATDSLPTQTLSFRWEYWKVSTSMVADRPLVGVGSGNFGRHYLQYKSIASPEEVEHPHNFLVSAATDWGLVGAVGLMAILVGVSRVGQRQRPPTSEAVSEDVKPLKQWLGWCLGLAVIIFLPRVALLGSDDPAYRFFATMLPLLAWVTAFVVTAAVQIERCSTLATGVGFALLAFLLQDTINFASLIPGTMTTAFALAAAMLASRYESGVAVAGHEIRRLQWWANAVLACLVTLVVGIVIPVGLCNRYLQRGREAKGVSDALQLYERAGKWDAFDPQPFFESARVHRSTARGEECGPYLAALEELEEAIERDPWHLLLHRMKSRCHLACGELTGSSAHFETAVRAAERVVHLYPTDPASHELLAECLATLGRSQRDADVLRRAAVHYRRALELDDARPAWEKIRRLRPGQREALEEAARRVDRLAEGWSRDAG